MPARFSHRSSSRAVRGFTLVEIMVVIVIIGILSALIIPSVVGKIAQARVARAKQDIRTLELALESYKGDNFRYPTTEQGLRALIEKPGDANIRHWREGGYVGRLEKDPWDNDYRYEYPGSHGKRFDLYTFGADSQEGGEGEDADIGNWSEPAQR